MCSPGAPLGGFPTHLGRGCAFFHRPELAACRAERKEPEPSLPRSNLKPTQSKDRRKRAYWAWTDDVNNRRQSFMLVARVRSSLRGQGGSSSPPPALEVSPPRVGCVWGMVFAHLARPHCLLFTVLAVALKFLFPDFTHSLGRGIGYPPRLKTYSLFHLRSIN